MPGTTTDSDGNGVEVARWEALETVLPLVYVTEFEPDGSFRYISEVVREWTGHAPEEFIADPELWYRCIHRDDVDRVRDAEDRSYYDVGQLNLEYRLVGPDGESRWVWERNTIVRNDAGAPICAHGTVVDLSRISAETVIDPMGQHSAILTARQNFLTGLPTGRALGEHLQLAIARCARSGQSVALLDIDLDRFSAVNDAVGMTAGDVVLVQVARRLCTCVRPGDLLAHSGGDEFLLMLCDIDSDVVDQVVRDVASRVSDTLADPFDVAGGQLNLRACIGYAVGPDDSPGADGVQRAAQAALSAAKAAGPDEVRHYEHGVSEATRRLSLEYRLRQAIEREEVVPYFQPIVALDTGAPIGVEALVRWETQEGVLGAAAFVPAVEDSPLIVDIDVHMIRRACQQARLWRDQGSELDMFVNVSSRMLAWHGFARVVLQAIDESGIDPSNLILELTETSAMVDETGSGPLAELDAAGVSIAIDDFGAAYSSIARLRALPASIVKIDRAVLLAATGGLLPSGRRGPASRTRSAGQVTLRHTLDFMHELGLRTVVEGIETTQVRDLVIGLGAELGQGFLFAEPVPAAEVGRILLA